MCVCVCGGGGGGGVHPSTPFVDLPLLIEKMAAVANQKMHCCHVFELLAEKMGKETCFKNLE